VDDLIVEFWPPADPISMNEGDTWGVRKRAAAWRDAAYFAWCSAHPGVGPAGRTALPSHVYVSIPFADRRRRDPINYAKTVKHIVDGFVIAGAWPDDHPGWVDQHIPDLRVDPRGLVLCRITPRISA
jgi:hypothetical protein